MTQIAMDQKPENERKTAMDTFLKTNRVLRQINSNLFCDNEKLVMIDEKTGNPECSFVVASNRELREKAYRLAYEVYRESSLVDFDPGKMVISAWDADPHTFTLLALDANERAIGTISLVFDSEKGLPCDDIYREEINTLRKQGRQLAEVSRLVVKKDCDNPREVLLRFFNLIYIYMVRVRKSTDFVIEINPHHFAYYQKKLLFEKIGEVKKCPRVKSAPAVLAKVSMDIGIQKVKQVGGARLRGKACADRTRYPWFWDYNDEPAIALHLYHYTQPMSNKEKEYFGLTGWEESLSQSSQRHGEGRQ